MTAQTSITPRPDRPQPAGNSESGAHVRAIERLGYTTREARFLAKVACAGGYFLRRHFATALGIGRGGSDAVFIDRLVANRHASRYGFCRAEQVFHLCSALFYSDQHAGRGRATRPRPALTITKRLMALDAVLAQTDCEFVCGQSDRIALCKRAGLALKDLPTRDYHPGGAPVRVSRVLPELPLLGCDRSVSTGTPHGLTLIAGYVAAPLETVAGFTTFMSTHAAMFAKGATWRVLFICQSAMQADQARRVFDRAMSADVRVGAARQEGLAREYCELRSLYDAQQWKQLDTTRIRRLFELKQRLGVVADHAYAAWQTRVGDVDRTAPIDVPAQPRARFEPLVVAHRYTALDAVRGLR